MYPSVPCACALSLPLPVQAPHSWRFLLLPLLMPEPAINLTLRPCAAQVTEKAGAEADEEVSLVAGRLQVDVAATNQQPIPLALLKARLLHFGPLKVSGQATAAGCTGCCSSAALCSGHLLHP